MTEAAPPSSTDLARAMSNDVVVVTGAGAGIGRVEAIRCGALGAAVVVNDIDGTAATKVADQITGAGGRAVACGESVVTAAGGRAIVNCALEAFGTVTAVVNNAGTLRPASFLQLTAERLEEMLDIHVRGAFFVTRPAWEHMAANGYGRVVLTSSSTALFSTHNNVAYGTAKAAVFGLMRALSLEGEECGVKVNVVMPYATTDLRKPDHSTMMADYEETTARHSLRHFDAPFDPQALGDRGSPDFVAAMVAYLCSRHCAVNGEAFSVWLGRYARAFVGLTEGVVAPAAQEASPEWVSTHIQEIRSRDAYAVPMSLYEENADAMRRVAGLL